MMSVYQRLESSEIKLPPVTADEEDELLLTFVELIHISPDLHIS
jgi:hypothetical protein